jgi:hypothetical protein
LHPDDVADRVDDELEVLRERIAQDPSLRAREPERTARFEFRVPFTKASYQAAFAMAVPIAGSPLVGWPPQQLKRPVLVRGARTERELVLRCVCDDYDSQPITAELLLPSGDPLPDGEWPKALGPGRELVIRGHEDYDRPFFCRRGLREFHSHPQHADQPWDRYREAVRIYHIVPELLTYLQTRWGLG